VVNIGVRPTFGESRLVVEAHLLDFTGDLYGRDVRLALLRRLREERRFPDVEALRRQIAADVAQARRELGSGDFTSG
jgi:riboflavin kinase/FMN adenylyltransferase